MFGVVFIHNSFQSFICLFSRILRCTRKTLVQFILYEIDVDVKLRGYSGYWHDVRTEPRYLSKRNFNEVTFMI